MKRAIVVVVFITLILGVALAQLQPVIPYDIMAQRTDPGQLYTAKNAWVVVNSVTDTGDEPTDLGAAERTYLTVVAAIATGASGDEKITIYGDDASERLEVSGWNGIRVRASGITNDGDIDYQVYAGTLEPGDTADCELAKIGQLEFVIGTQASITATYEMADAVVATASDSVSSWSTVGAASNTIGEAQIDLGGANVLVLVPTVVDADSRLHIKGF